MSPEMKAKFQQAEVGEDDEDDMLSPCSYSYICFYRDDVFTPLRVGGPPTPQAFLANSNTYTKNHSKTFFFS